MDKSLLGDSTFKSVRFLQFQLGSVDGVDSDANVPIRLFNLMDRDGQPRKTVAVVELWAFSRWGGRRKCLTRKGGERVKGIEPSYAVWETAVLPLNYTREKL